MKTTPRNDKEPKLLVDHSVVLLMSVQNIRMPECLPYIQEIHRRAEAITPVLKEILNFRPGPQWDE